MKDIYDFQPGNIVRFKLRPGFDHYESFGGYDMELVRKLIETDKGYNSHQEKWYFRPLEGHKVGMEVGSMRVTVDMMEFKSFGYPPTAITAFKNDGLPKI